MTSKTAFYLARHMSVARSQKIVFFFNGQRLRGSIVCNSEYPLHFVCCSDVSAMCYDVPFVDITFEEICERSEQD